jgi:myo-inositol-1(or 4)-monophosphatase
MALRLSPHITVMANAAQKASKRLLRDFAEVEQLQVSIKGPSDFVSQADIRAEQTLKEVGVRQLGLAMGGRSA